MKFTGKSGKMLIAAEKARKMKITFDKPLINAGKWTPNSKHGHWKSRDFDLTFSKMAAVDLN